MKLIVQTPFWVALSILTMTNCRMKRNESLRTEVRTSVWLESEAFQQWCRFTFHQDSGFLSSAQNSFLQEIIIQNDTSVFSQAYTELVLLDSQYSIKNISAIGTFKRDSSGGKYYRGRVVNGSTQWLLCAPFTVSSFGSDPFVFEITEDDGRFCLNSWQDFHHGNYDCCLNCSDGFFKIGQWFFVNTCGTGSGFCDNTANLLFFPLNDPADTMDNPQSIPVIFHQRFTE